MIVRMFNMFWILKLVSYMMQVLSPIMWVTLFTILIVSFDAQKFLILMKSSVYFVACAFGVIVKKSLPNSMS